MNCEDTKDWFACYAAVGVAWLTLKSLTLLKWTGWLIVIPLLIIFGLPLVFLGWLLEKKK